MRRLFLFEAMLHSTVKGRGEGRLLNDPNFHYCPLYAVLWPHFLVNIINSGKISAASSTCSTHTEARQAGRGKSAFLGTG